MKMKTINKTILTILTLAGLMFLSGCASISPDARTSADLQERNEAMWRVEVARKAPQYKVEEMVDAYEGDDERVMRIFGRTSADMRTRELITFLTLDGFGEAKAGGMFVDPKWNLQPGDIIDMLSGRGPVKTMIKGEAIGLCGNIFGTWSVCRGDEYPSLETPGQVLGVVCRNTERSCRNNSSAGTMIGIGRKILSASEYRGVEAESQQPIREDSFNLSETFYSDSCTDCADDDTIIYVD